MFKPNECNDAKQYKFVTIEQLNLERVLVFSEKPW